ncbi:hypothetical protein L2E82_10355 [Cichorium intybus]|uniref:Uncharacterized protein n=1 Tax=Cichorium intybus TaxID=13427 RepID=A0ACB9GAD5_CICIN|nr:hypothetical protein L2E82_10355 [Cichorium intybus]
MASALLSLRSTALRVVMMKRWPPHMVPAVSLSVEDGHICYSFLIEESRRLMTDHLELGSSNVVLALLAQWLSIMLFELL